MDLSSSVVLSRMLARGKFRHVQVLLKLAELGSVQRTADAIGMTQSSVTQTLAYLERMLETQLFHRHARGVRPTAAGATLLPVARQLLHGLTEGAEVIALHHRRGKARSACWHRLRRRKVCWCRRCCASTRKRRRFRCSCVKRKAKTSCSRSRAARSTVACRKPPVIPEGWHFQPLLDDRLAVVCRSDNPLARARRVGWAQLAEETRMLLPAGWRRASASTRCCRAFRMRRRCIRS
ncbi:LysR family transcriptional regulator [Ramlibacter terrae]|uniref:LysR family transcriptional regulator n=1 Tax=Ramlibacter terrae TaxID=2732511 RepID=A0ABX6P262_9BURK|nr:LysR family transcriptional regulator [Ramlibacter terrae]